MAGVKLSLDFPIDYSVFAQRCSQELTSLTIKRAKFVTPVMVEHLAQCEDLTELRMNYTHISLCQFHCLKRLRKLKTLNLSVTSIGDDALIGILENNFNLEHLIIDHCVCLQNLDAIASTVARFNKKLKTWSYAAQLASPSLTIAGLEQFSLCLHLKKLILKFCLVPLGLGNSKNFALNCLNLEDVEIWGWDNIEDYSLFSILWGLLNLKCLDIRQNSRISVGFINLALKQFSKLQVLTVDFEHIPTEILDEWRSKRPNARIINVFEEKKAVLQNQQLWD